MSKHHRLTQALLSILLLSGVVSISTSCSNSSNAADTRNLAEKQKQLEADSLNLITDAQFMITAAEFNLRQIKLGQLAQLSGKITEVKELGKMMEAYHTVSLTDLTSLGRQKGMNVPTSATNDVEDVYNALKSKTGSDFDREYCNRVVTRHKEVIDIFEKATAEATDANVKAWAIITLPGLHTHLDHAIACQNKLDEMELLNAQASNKN